MLRFVFRPISLFVRSGRNRRWPLRGGLDAVSRAPSQTSISLVLRRRLVSVRARLLPSLWLQRKMVYEDVAFDYACNGRTRRKRAVAQFKWTRRPNSLKLPFPRPPRTVSFMHPRTRAQCGTESWSYPAGRCTPALLATPPLLHLPPVFRLPPPHVPMSMSMCRPRPPRARAPAAAPSALGPARRSSPGCAGFCRFRGIRPRGRRVWLGRIARRSIASPRGARAGAPRGRVACRSRPFSLPPLGRRRRSSWRFRGVPCRALAI